MKAKTYSTLQKIYDQSSLICSTAVYYESQENDVEALRCWHECLAQLQGYNAGGYQPCTESERTLLQSLKTMQGQCQDRAGLLQAILLSKMETGGHGQRWRNTSDSRRVAGPVKSPSINTTAHPTASFTPPTLPKLPPIPSSPSVGPLPPRPIGSTQSTGTTSHDTAPRLSRIPSPEKRTFLSTLRPARNEKKGEPSSKVEAAAMKAAIIAWSSISRVEGANIACTLSAPLVNALPVRQDYRTTVSVSNIPNEQWPSSVTFEQPSPPRMNTERPGLYGIKRCPSSTTIPPRSPTQSTFGSGPPALPHHVCLKGKSCAVSPRLPVISQNKQAPRYHSKIELDLSIPPTPPPETPPKPIKPPRLAHLNLPVSRKPVPEPTLRTSSEQNNYSQQILHIISGNLGEDSSRKRNQEHGNTGITTSSEEIRSRDNVKIEGNDRVAKALKTISKGVDMQAALQVANEIVVQGDEVKWDDVVGLDAAKLALKEAVVYPFLRPDLFSGLREPARGMLLFGPPGTGKTMLARAVATESKSTFFSISASSLMSKYLGESEKLVRALFALAKALAPSIIFVDEIDSLLSSRNRSGEHEATRRIKTEFLIQWSHLARAAAGKEGDTGDASSVLVLAATNLPWAIDDAARRRFVRRQYIPLPEGPTREKQVLRLLSHQKYQLSQVELERLVKLTDGFSGSDMTALAKDASMGPLRSLGEALLLTEKDDIRPIAFSDFEASLSSIRPSVSKEGLQAFEDWAKQYGERV